MNQRLTASPKTAPAAAPSAGVVLRRTCACGGPAGFQGECEECKQQKEASVQRRAQGASSPAIAPPIVHAELRSPGRPLDADTRSTMELRLGHDFGNVRVHTGAQAAESARAVNAMAYTVGADVVFAEGRYAPQDAAGRRLLAHELMHVIQQRGAGNAAAQERLTVGPADDPAEREAERAAERPVSTPRGQVRVQRVMAPKPTEEPASKAPAQPAAASLIADDESRDLSPGQMHKSEFLDQLRTAVCATADSALAAVGRTAKGCPYIERWIGHFQNQDGRHVERAIRKYAPESTSVRSAHEYIPLVAARVQRGVARWAATGEMTGVPDELKGEIPGGGLLGAVGGTLAGIGGAIAGAVSGVVGGIGQAASGIGGLFTKAREGGARDAGNPQAIQAQLNSGAPLDGGLKGRMESAFGHDFSRVRIHDNSRADRLSANLNARAFTVGYDIAFGAGEYRPGTLVGDAIVAHELAHVVQQSRGNSSPAARDTASTEYGNLEEDADISATRAMVLIWSGARAGLANISRNAIPALRSGLRLQRCSQTVEKRCPKGYSWRVRPGGTTGIGSFGCLCHWQCLPGEPERPMSQMAYRCPPGMNCDTGVKSEELDLSYTKTGYGAAMTPIGQQPYCGCFPLDLEGQKISDVPMRPTDFEMTDVVGPLVDIAAAARSRARPRLDPTTGKPLPEEPVSTTGPARPKTVIMGDLGTDVAVGNARVADYRSRLGVSLRKNIAFADYDFSGNKGTVMGISGEKETRGVPRTAQPQLPNVIADFPREFDSEKKIFEHFSSLLGVNPDATGTINLFSERPICVGCDVVIAEFRKKYPKVIVNVVSGGAR
jgi:hypothetical protein